MSDVCFGVGPGPLSCESLWGADPIAGAYSRQPEADGIRAARAGGLEQRRGARFAARGRHEPSVRSADCGGKEGERRGVGPAASGRGVGLLSVTF
eukprot:2610658-Pyramimonas_sp.AAC.1